ncbi:MAG: RDD family protein [Verrucomicrobia bacterium]|nr:MAG: RDD family protein [Verrucomicrobiota bacterium]
MRRSLPGTVPLLTESWEEWLRFATIAAPINTAVAVLFSLFFILREEATPGKRLFGLRVVRADGGRLKAGRVIGRYFAEQLSGLLFLSGYLMAAFDEEKRTLHDYLCKTRVVKGPRMEQEL